MALKSDSQGFLIGDPVDINSFSNHLRSIKSDVAAIKRAIIGNGSINAPSRSSSRSATPASTNSGSSRSSKSSSRSSSAEKVQTSSSRAGGSVSSSSSKSVATVSNRGGVGVGAGNATKMRDSSGRFTSGGESGSEKQASMSMLSGFADRIAAAVSTSANGAEEVDPTVKAFKEVAEPMQRGYSVLFGGGDKKDRWYRKIFGELKLFRKEETVFNRAANKTLKSIDEKPIGGGDGDDSFMGGATGSIVGRLLPWIIGGIATAVTTGIGGIGSLLTGILATVFTPVGAAVAAAGVAAWGLFTDDGRKFFSDMGSKIADGWKSVTDWFVKSFPVAAEAINKVGEVAGSAIDSVKGVAGKIADVVSEQAKDAGNYLVKSSPKTMEAIGKAKELGGKAWEGAKSAGNWVLGQTSKLFESGKGGAGTVSSGAGDYGGASYGTYQLSSKQGTLQNFLKSSKYGDQFKGLKPGSAEFNAKWKDIAASDPEFGNSQHDFIKNTHFDPAMAKLAKGGIDLSGRGAAVNDALWSTSVQFGAGGGSGLIKKALAGKNASSMSDAEIVSAIQDYKLANNDSLFSSSSAKTRAGTASRAMAEKEKLLSLASVSTSAKTPIIPVMPSSPQLADAPSVAMPLGSGQSRPMTINLPSQDIGQDLSDRSIAHIATGGYAKS